MKCGKIMVGFGLGVITGMLLAPKKGSELRADIKEKSITVYDKASSMTMEDYQEMVSSKIDDIKKSIDEFDIHEFKDATAQKISDLRDKVEEMSDAMHESKEYEKMKDVLKRVGDSVSERFEDVKAKVSGSEVDSTLEKVAKEEIQAIEDDIDVVLKELKD